MKNIIKSILVASAAISSSMVQANNIEFEITGVNSNKGKIYIQLFKGQENYTQNIAEASSVIKAEKGAIKAIFNNISAGEYALRFFHDENNDGKLATNFLGMPQEGYGFSNNAKPNFGPASYHDMKFLVSENDATVKNTTTVIY